MNQKQARKKLLDLAIDLQSMSGVLAMMQKDLLDCELALTEAANGQPVVPGLEKLIVVKDETEPEPVRASEVEDEE